MSTISMNCRRAASFADAQRLSRTHSVFHAYGSNHGSKPQLWHVPLYRGSPTEESEKIPKDRKPSFCIRYEKGKHEI